MNIALVIGVFFLKTIDLLHLNYIAFHSSHFAHAGHPPAPVRQTLQLDEQLDRGGDLTANTRADTAKPAMATICSRRLIASRGVLAWMVVMEPS